MMGVIKRKQTVFQEKLVKTIKDYKDPITLANLSDLMGWDMSRTYSVFGNLRKNGRLEVDKTRTGSVGEKKTKYQFRHFGNRIPKKVNKIAEKEYFNEDGDPIGEVNVLDLMLEEPGVKDNTKPVSQRFGNTKRCTVERGYYFLMAGISKSSGEFADFFGISEEQAMKIIAAIAARYPSEIKVTMRACLHR